MFSNKEMINLLYYHDDMSKKRAKDIIQLLMNEIKSELLLGRKVKIQDICTLVLKPQNRTKTKNLPNTKKYTLRPFRLKCTP